MILFFYGPNTYLLNRKLLELKAKYLAASGDNFNLSILDGENLTYNDFAAQTQAMPLLATSRLVLIEGIFKNKNKKGRTISYDPRRPLSSIGGN